MEDIQNYLNQEIGVVQNVDTKKVSVSVEKEEILYTSVTKMLD